MKTGENPPVECLASPATAFGTLPKPSASVATGFQTLPKRLVRLATGFRTLLKAGSKKFPVLGLFQNAPHAWNRFRNSSGTTCKTCSGFWNSSETACKPATGSETLPKRLATRAMASRTLPKLPADLQRVLELFRNRLQALQRVSKLFQKLRRNSFLFWNCSGMPRKLAAAFGRLLQPLAGLATDSETPEYWMPMLQETLREAGISRFGIFFVCCCACKIFGARSEVVDGEVLQQSPTINQMLDLNFPSNVQL